MLLGVPLYVVGGAALIVMSLPLLAWAFAGGRHTVHKNAALEFSADERVAVLSQGPMERAIMPAARAIGHRVRAFTPVGWVARLTRHVKLAGSSNVWTVERILAIKFLLGGAVLFGGLTMVSGDLAPKTVGLVALSALLAYHVPDVILYGRARERQQQIARDLPDTLDQLTISVEAGLGFDAALQRVAMAGEGVLAEELRRTLNEITVGLTRTEALRHLSERTDVQELRHFVLTLSQAEQYGLPIARILRIQSADLRLKRRQRAEEEAMKIPVKIVFPLVFCIFPALFVVLLGPAVIRVMRALM